jgi:hypothetical protein
MTMTSSSAPPSTFPTFDNLANSSNWDDKSVRQPLKAISLWQPWAIAIALSLKTWETRSWKTHYRGWLVICAAQKTSRQQQETYVRICHQHHIDLSIHPWSQLPRGCAVALVNLTDCVLITEELIAQQSEIERSLGDWQPGRYAWKLEQLHLLTPPIPVKGKQGLWNFPLPVAELNHCIQSISPTNKLTESSNSITAPIPISPTNELTEQFNSVTTPKPISPTNKSSPQTASVAHPSPFLSHPSASALSISPTNADHCKVPLCKAFPAHSLATVSPALSNGGVNSTFVSAASSSSLFVGEIELPTSDSNPNLFVGEIDNQTRFPWTPPASETFVGEIDFTTIPHRHPYPQLSSNGQSVAHPTKFPVTDSKNFGAAVEGNNGSCTSPTSTLISKPFVGEIAPPLLFPNSNSQLNSGLPGLVAISPTNTSSLLAVNLHLNQAISPTNTSSQRTCDCCNHLAISPTNVSLPQLPISPTNATIEEKAECPFTVGMYVALTVDDGNRQAGEKGQVTAIGDYELVVTWEDTRKPQQTVYELTSVALPLRRLGRKPGSRNRKPASGTLRQRTEKKRLASGQIAEFPRVAGKRDRSLPHHWFWTYEYSHKSANGKWRTIKRGVPRSCIATVRDAIRRSLPLRDRVTPTHCRYSQTAGN